MIEKLLGEDPLLHNKSWYGMKVWYKAVVEPVHLLTQVTLKRIRTERVNLYRHVQPLGENIPIYVEPFQV